MARSDHQWRILGVWCLAVLLVVIDNTIVNVALPSLSRDLHATNSQLQWIVDGYSLPFAALMLAGGGLADRLGRRIVMLSGLAAFTAFSGLAAMSHSVTTLLVARALMGASAAFIFPATLSVVTVTFKDPKQRAAAFGIWGATAGVAVAIGPIAGGELITHFWYGSIFLVNLPVGVLTIGAIAAIVPESKNPVKRRLDLVGLVLGTLMVLSLTLAIIEGPSWGWLSVSTLSLFAFALVMLVFFVRYEGHREGPLFEVKIFRNAAFSAGAGSIAVNFFMLFGFIFLVTQYFQLVRGYSALSAGVRTLPFALVVMVTTPLSGFLAGRVAARWLVSGGLITMSAGLIWIGTQPMQSAYFGPVVGAMVLLAVGFSFINAPATSSTMGSLPAHQVGAGAAVNEVNRELGGTLGVAVVGSVFASVFGSRIRSALEPYVAHGLPHQAVKIAQSSMQAASVVVSKFPANARPGAQHAIDMAFMDAFHRSCFVGAGVGICAGIAVFIALPSTIAGSDAKSLPGSH